MAGGPTPLQRIEQLRRLRVRGGSPDLSVRSDAESVSRELKRLQRASGGLHDRWGGIAPEALVQVVRPGRVWRGTLTLNAADAAAKYECERWLASGGDAVLRGAVKGLRSIKVVIG